jgi:hypothetical protein
MLDRFSLIQRHMSRLSLALTANEVEYARCQVPC